MMMDDVRRCGMCCDTISDRYIMRVADTSYHERCLLCAICGIRLAETCFSRDSKLLCRLDYDSGSETMKGSEPFTQKVEYYLVSGGTKLKAIDFHDCLLRHGVRLYGKKCLGCSERISADSLVMRALDSIFHLRCFVCVVCGVRLQRGDQFVIKQGQLFCRPDYEKEVEMLQGYAQGEFGCDDLMASSRAQDGRRGPKRPRTILTTQQRRAFKASFEVSPKPCRKVREALAKDTGLSVRIVQGPKRQHTMLTSQQREAFKQYFRICPKPGCKVREGLAKQTGLSSRIVQVWFQNQRAKMKKIQKKARQDSKTKDGDSGDEKKMKLKEEDSPGSRNFLNEDSDTSVSTLPTTDSFLNTHPPTSEDQVPHQNIKQEILENQDGFFNHNHHHIQPRDFASGHSDRIESEFLGFTHPLYLSHASLNPIDRLYSMQNTYFCGEDTTLVDQ